MACARIYLGSLAKDITTWIIRIAHIPPVETCPHSVQVNSYPPVHIAMEPADRGSISKGNCLPAPLSGSMFVGGG